MDGTARSVHVFSATVTPNPILVVILRKEQSCT